MLAVLFSVVVLAASAYGREYNCTINAALCTGSGAQTVTLNGESMCCPPTATVHMNNNECKCVETPDASAEEPCRKGVRSCRHANSFSTDSQGEMRCCMPGYALKSVINSNIQGQVMDFCVCSPQTNGGFLSTFMGMANGGNNMFMSGFPGLGMENKTGTGNATELREEWRKMGNAWRNWGRQFTQGFRNWGQNFGQSMRNTGLDLARNLGGVLQSTVAGAARPIQRAVNDFIGNIFSSIPGK